MILDNIIRSIAEGNIEQILLYLPIFIILIGTSILAGIYLRDSWPTLLNMLLRLISKARRVKPQRIVEVKEEKQKIDYPREIEDLLKEKDSSKAMDRLSVLINQYFAQLFNLHEVFTYEELISELEKRKKINLKEFCEKLVRIEFSKNEVSRKELEDISDEFLSLIKKPSLRLIISPRRLVRKFKIIENFKRFRKELQRDLEREKTIQDKIVKFVEKIVTSSFGLVGGYFLPAKTPKKVSFEAVLEDVRQQKTKRSFRTIIAEDKPTVEGLLYFVYLAIRKKLRENQKLSEINQIIKQGKQSLLEKQDVIQAETLYYSLIPIYVSLPDESKKKILPKIVLFYESINDVVKLQEAVRYLFQLKLALESNEKERAEQFYWMVSKIYEQLPAEYKNEIYEQFLGLERELNANNLKR